MKSKQQLVLKISDQHDMLAKEIHTIRKVNHVTHQRHQAAQRAGALNRKYGDDDSIYTVPKLLDFGMLIMYDFEKATKDGKRLCGYYIMPKYQVHLDEYLKDL